MDPYIKNRAIYACPGAPELEIGVALNEALAGARLGDLPKPAETVLFFSSDNGIDIPFGGPDSVAPGRFAGRVTVGFADGHTQMMRPDEVKRQLEKNPFE